MIEYLVDWQHSFHNFMHIIKCVQRKNQNTFQIHPKNLNNLQYMESILQAWNVIAQVVSSRLQLWGRNRLAAVVVLWIKEKVFLCNWFSTMSMLAIFFVWQNVWSIFGWKVWTLPIDVFTSDWRNSCAFQFSIFLN